MLFGLAGSDLARITLWVDVSGNSEKDEFVRGMTGAREDSEETVVEIQVRDQSFSQSSAGRMNYRNS